MNFENLSLSEIVTSRPEAAVLFENYNLDFCCGGKRKLADVLKNDSTKLKEVTTHLEALFENATIPEIDFNKLSLTQLVDYILNNHHQYVKNILPVLLQHLEKVAIKHGDKYPEMKRIKTLFEEIKHDFEQHMFKEESLLFPQIKNLEFLALEGNSTTAKSAIEEPILMMEDEHESAHQLIEEIKQLSHNFMPPPDACTTFRLSLEELKDFEKNLHRHVHLENNILFPKAITLQKHLSNLRLNKPLS